MKLKNSKKLILLMLIVSLTFNLLVIFMDTVPYLWPKIESKFFNSEGNITKLKTPENQIVNKSLELADTDQVTMIFSEQASFTEELLKLRSRNQNSLYKQYNYPKAFLISGLTDYARSKNDTVLMLKTAKAFDRYIDSEGLPTFTFDKVDQVPFGIAAINIFKFTNDIRYKKFADFIYAKTILLAEKETNIILYRKGFNIQYVDVLGMICPFLVRYEEINKGCNAISLAKNQLEYYTKFGVDKETYLPTHGINVKKNIKIGPTNWGRGIGWYMIALAEYSKNQGTYSKELDGLINTLNKVKTEDLVWSQFPGLSEQFDASSTTMFMYSINLVKPGTYSKKDVFEILGKYITMDGIIKSTSGDTYDINNYSKSFGNSELSQGMLLMLLSTTNNK